MNVRKTLEEMLKVFDEKDWIQGTMYRPYGASIEEITGVCLAGSYTYAALTGMVSANDWYLVSPVILEAVEDLFPGRPGWSVPGFNDHKDTTVEDARLVVKSAIEKAREAS